MASIPAKPASAPPVPGEPALAATAAPAAPAAPPADPRILDRSGAMPRKPLKKKPLTVAQVPIIGNYQLPPIDLLALPDTTVKPTESKEELMANARQMQQTLAQFDIEVQLGDITKGPTITRYELHPAPGVKLEKILNLSNNLAAALKAWQDVDYGPVPPDTDLKTNVWMQDGPNVFYARTVVGRGAAMTMGDVSWYRRDPTGMVTEIVHAPHAQFARPGWRLDRPTSFDVQSTKLTPLGGPRVYANAVDPTQVLMRKTNADGESLWRLTDTIEAIHGAGYRTSELDGRWWHKLSGPLSALLMPLLGAVAGFGLARSGKLFVRALIGMALGFAYFVVDNAALAMGNFGAYTPFLAAWSPFLLFLLIGEAVLIRTEE